MGLDDAIDNRLLIAFHQISTFCSNATASGLELGLELDAILEELTEGLGFEFATVSLVDGYRNIIETIRAKNVPLGWMRSAKHLLDSSDIQADIVRTAKTEVIAGWDDRFDRDIYERFEHEKLARIFAPLLATGRCIGTIEAGCQRAEQASILTPLAIQTVERLGQTRGPRIARFSPFVLLESIANHAINIIGADSASIYVYQSDQLLLAAGAGRATPDFVRKFSPRPTGMGRRAIQTGSPIIIDSSPDYAVENLNVYSEGVRAVAVFPLSLGPDIQGVLYVHFWRPHRFTPNEIKFEEALAHQMGTAIQNYFLMRSMGEAAERAWALSELQRVIQSLASSFELPQVLENTAQNVLLMFDADNVTLYEFFSEKQLFDIPPIMKGSFRDSESMKRRREHGSIVREMLERNSSIFVEDVTSEPMLSGIRSGSTDLPRFVEREEIKSCAALVLRSGDTEEIMGIMFVNYRTPRTFKDQEQKAINAVASTAAIAIKTTRLYEQVNQNFYRRAKELAALHDIDKSMIAGSQLSNFEPVLKLILDKATEIIDASIGVILWFNPWEKILELKFHKGLTIDPEYTRQELDEGIIGLAIEKKKAILVPDVTIDKWASKYKAVVPGMRSELVVPMFDENGILGVINLEHIAVGAFSKEDQALLEGLAVQAVIAVHSVDSYQKLQRQIKPLRTLSLIATRLQVASYELDTVLRLLLTGVTAGEGLGFSRVMLFLTDEKGTYLQGKIAIGAKTREEAETTWKTIEVEAENYKKGGKDTLEYLLDRAEEFTTTVRQGLNPDEPLSALVRNLSIPIERNAGAPAACILENRPILVKYDQNDRFRHIINQSSGGINNAYAFVCMPLRGRERPIGVLIADNRFLFSEKAINEEDIISLEGFSSVVAMNIENIGLRAHLVEKQRLEAWEVLIAEVGHYLNKRVGAIKNEVEIFEKHLVQSAEDVAIMSELKDCLKYLKEDINKAQIALRDLREFGLPLNLKCTETDLREIIEKMQEEAKRTLNCDIEITELPSQPIVLSTDRLKISESIMELIINAKEAVELCKLEQPHIMIKLSIDTLISSPEKMVCIEISDNGPGIPEINKNKIFIPFVSSKQVTGRNSGLGLSRVKKIVDRLGGGVEEVGREGDGARFIIRLPIVG